jgi:hypothetical protein
MMMSFPLKTDPAGMLVWCHEMEGRWIRKWLTEEQKKALLQEVEKASTNEEILRKFEIFV